MKIFDKNKCLPPILLIVKKNTGTGNSLINCTKMLMKYWDQH